MGFERAARTVKPTNADESAPFSQRRVVVQRKMTVGAVDDPAEHDADRIAEDAIHRLRADNSTLLARANAPSARIRRAPAGAAASGAEFTPDASVEQRINRAAGSGSRLDVPVRQRFEAAMGADLSGVRIHRSAEADRLNGELHAEAFTAGNDVFFSAGSYSPGTTAGDHLLAHELAHTIQQQPRVRRQVIRRFALDKPDFSRATSMTVFGGGGSGNVAEISDGQGSLIVKVDQLIGNEVVVAGRLHAGVADKAGGKGGYTILSPGVRLATLMERLDIQAAATRLVDPAKARNFLTGMGSANEVVIMDKAPGRDLQEILRDKQSLTTTDTSGDQTADPHSIVMQICTNPGPLTTLGQALPVDVFMGMQDRMIGAFNPENFRFDEATSTLAFVDNTQNRAEGYLTSVDLGGQVVLPKAGFDIWAASALTTNLVKSPKKLAEQMFTDFTGIDHSWGVLQALGGKSTGKRPNPVGDAFDAAARKRKAKMVGWIQNGIKKGHTALLKRLADPLTLVAGLPDPAKSEALQSLIARRYVLKGLKPDAAWAKAAKEAAKLYTPSASSGAPRGQLPPLPAQPAQPTWVKGTPTRPKSPVPART